MSKRSNTGSSSASTQALEADYLSTSLTNSELLRRLKVVTGVLEAYGDDDDAVNQAKRDIHNIAEAVGSDWLIDHKNKDVRLLAACALTDVLRIYAPDPPYDEDTNAQIIRLFLRILRGFESPDMIPDNNLSFSIHFHILERLSVISIFSIINELSKHRDQLLIELARTAYDIAGSMASHTSTHKVTDHLSSILCCVIEEIESYNMDIFDLVVGALCASEKKENPGGFSMMKAVIASCENNFQPFVERRIHQVKAGLHLESELSNDERLAQAVFELSSIAPRVLTQILPAYAEDLVVDDQSVRIKAVKLLGAVFSVGNFYRDYAIVFAEFKRRSLDKEPEVRRAMVGVLGVLLQNRPELSKPLLEDMFVFQGDQRDAPLYSLVVDGDERVRKDAVECVLQLALNCPESVSSSFLRHVGERTLDRRLPVRQAAIEGLCKLYQKFCSPFDRKNLTQSVVDKYTWIPNRVITLTSSADAELKSFIVNCLEEVCLNVSSEGSDRSPANVALDLFSWLDEKGRAQMGAIIKSKAKYQESFLKFAKLRDSSSKRDIMDDVGDAEESQLVDKLSQFFPDKSRAGDLHRKLLETKGPKIWEGLVGLIDKPRGFKETEQALEDIQRRLGPKSPIMDFVRQVVWKISDRFFGYEFVSLVLQHLIRGNDVSNVAEGLPVLVTLASICPNIFASLHKELKKVLQACKDRQDILQEILHVAMLACDVLTPLKTDTEFFNQLANQCGGDNSSAAKFACRVLIKIAGADSKASKSVLKNALGSLELSSKSPVVLSVLSEFAKSSSSTLSGSDQSNILSFARSLFKSGGTTAGKKDKKLVLNTRIYALKMITSLILGHDSHHDKKDDSKLREMLSELHEIVENNGRVGGESLPDPERAQLRLVAGSCILKVAKTLNLKHLVAARHFASVARLCEDNDLSVRKEIVKKIWKGSGIQHGKLPFHYAAMLALGAHESDSAQLDLFKTVLRNILAVMKKLRSSSGKVLLSLSPERILPWIIYLLSHHPHYVDEEEEESQVSIAFKKYLELFFNTVTQSGTDEKIFPMLWQILEHIRGCSVAEEANVIDEPKIVSRNLRIACEVGKRLVTKFGGQKKWDSEVLKEHLMRIIDHQLFIPLPGGAPAQSFDLGLSPAGSKIGSSVLSTPTHKLGTSEHKNPAFSSPSAQKKLFNDSLALSEIKDSESKKGRTRKSDDSGAVSSVEAKKQLFASPRPVASKRNSQKLPATEEAVDTSAASSPSHSDKPPVESAKDSTRGRSRKQATDSPQASSRNASVPTTPASESGRANRKLLSSPELSQRSSRSSPRDSTVHAEQVMSKQTQQTKRKGSKPSSSPPEQNEQKVVPKTKATNPKAASKATTPNSKGASSQSTGLDVFDLDYDEVSKDREPKRPKSNGTSSSNTKASMASAKLSSAKSASPASTKSPAAQIAASPASSTGRTQGRASAGKVSESAKPAAPPKGRASASHEQGPSKALAKLNDNLGKRGRALPRRGASPAVEEEEEEEVQNKVAAKAAPAAKAKRRRL
mmetsp:Transcript_29116/g.76383  ORF Transcript_29116/g.76383 Transcript_29116/m.76383 type:complete len:1523 (-) Transcript_29116:320-4888(-)